MKKKARQIGGLFLLCLASAACTPHQGAAPAVADGGGSIDTMAENPAESNKHLESITGIPLPQNSQVLNWETVAGSDKLVRAVLAMARADFDQWIARYNLIQGDFSDDRRYLLGPSTDGWDVKTPASLPTAQIMFDNSTALNVAYTEMPNGQLRVYWLFHGI